MDRVRASPLQFSARGQPTKGQTFCFIYLPECWPAFLSKRFTQRKSRACRRCAANASSVLRTPPNRNYRTSLQAALRRVRRAVMRADCVCVCVCVSALCLFARAHSRVHKAPGTLERVVPPAREKPLSSVGPVASCLGGSRAVTWPGHANTDADTTVKAIWLFARPCGGTRKGVGGQGK